MAHTWARKVGTGRCWGLTGGQLPAYYTRWTPGQYETISKINKVDCVRGMTPKVVVWPLHTCVHTCTWHTWTYIHTKNPTGSAVTMKKTHCSLLVLYQQQWRRRKTQTRKLMPYTSQHFAAPRHSILWLHLTYVNQRTKKSNPKFRFPEPLYIYTVFSQQLSDQNQIFQ